MARISLFLALFLGILPLTASLAQAPTCEQILAGRIHAPARIQIGTTPVRQIIPGVFYLVFDSQHEVASTLLRFQEHYESPEFRGRIFTLEEYKEWYIRERGAFTYYSDWAGFNFPSRVLEPFFDGGFDPLSTREQSIVDHFKQYRGKKFYVIATYKGGEEVGTAEHETAHALYFMNQDYHREVDAVLATIDQAPLHAYLGRSAGYHPSVFQDETHAYLINGWESFAHAGIDMTPYLAARAKLRAIFERYFRAALALLR